MRATPEAVAILLIAILATDSLSETGPKTVEMACAASEKEPSKWMIGRSFANALAEILTSKELVEHVNEIVVSRSNRIGIIELIDNSVNTDDGVYIRSLGEASPFRFIAPPPLLKPKISVNAGISGEEVRLIAADVRAMMVQEPAK